MLAAPPPRTDKDEVQALLRAWHSASPGDRIAPDRVGVAAIEPLSVWRVALASICEGRGVYVRPQRAVARVPGARAVPDIDPWSVGGLELPADAPIGRRVELELPGEERCDCEACRGQGQRTCSPCRGSGWLGSGRQRTQCTSCSGRGTTPCSRCNGLGGFAGAPIAWSEIVKTTAVRLVKDDALPPEVALALDEVLERGGGTVVFERAADELDLREVGSASYRDAPPPARFAEAATSLLAEGDVGRAKVRSRKLEVRRAAAFRVRREDGTSFLAWGWPARVEPSDALDSTFGRIVRAATWVVVALAILAGLYAFVALRRGG
jgi:hypothetical protein